MMSLHLQPLTFHKKYFVTLKVKVVERLDKKVYLLLNTCQLNWAKKLVSTGHGQPRGLVQYISTINDA